MPRYDFTCTKCGVEEARIVEIKNREKQKCECVLSEGVKCKGKMERTEEISSTGRMTVQWAGWAD